ncbi:MAG: hypothetical protein ACK4RK_12100 [Gemmataceae bacterium]
MRAQTVWLGILIAAMFGAGGIRGQSSYLEDPRYADIDEDLDAPPPAPPYVQPPGYLSDYIKYTCPECCGPIGKHGPLLWDVYFVNGVSRPVAGGNLNRVLSTGYMFGGGVRSVLYNPPGTWAVSVDLGVTHVVNGGTQQHLSYPVVVGLGNLRNLNRTTANLGLSQEWYLLGSCYNPGGWNWKVGATGGGRWGAAYAQLNVFELPGGFRRRSDVVKGFYLGASSDVEIPRQCCTFVVGLQVEWDMLWMSILPNTDLFGTNLQNVNFLVRTGIRF